MIKNIFNFCIPTEYIDKDGNINYRLPFSNERMTVLEFQTIHAAAKPNAPKLANPWVQFFSCGYRVTQENLDWKNWNGFTQADVDSKLFYNNEHAFNVDILLKAIHINADSVCPDNYFCVQKSSGGKGYSILFYWDCEKTELNFKKCCLLTEQFTKKIFYCVGPHGAEIIDYSKDGKRVLDKCSNSIFQGIYVNAFELLVSDKIDNPDYGKIELDSIELIIESISSTKPINKDFNQKEHVIYNKKIKVDNTLICYYNHYQRRCIYEALIVVFNNKDKVDEEWNYISELIPEENGHKHSFYKQEPNKNKWYQKYNENVYHNTSWLTNFGYIYDDKTEYIYKDQFTKSWKKHIRKCILGLLPQPDIHQIEKDVLVNHPNAKGKELLKLIEEKVNEYNKKREEELVDKTIFDEYFDNNITEKENIDKLNYFRNNFYKTKFDKKDFKYLVNGYEIPNDIVTYKMYADFYYRDENNLPLLKFDILENDVLVYGYWPETNKTQWHTFKFNDEYTHWKNNENFSSKTTKQDLQFAVTKYAARWQNFHTIRQYLYSLDLNKANTELLETWAQRYFKAKDTKLTRTICRNFFIAAVKKQLIENPNTFTFQHMLCLQGPTGCGKTFFLVNMFTINNKSYILNKIDPNGKDNEIGPLIAKNWLLQFGESENLTKVSVNAQKEFVDRMNLGLKFQEKYQVEQTTVYPRVVIARTTNEETFLNDISINEGDRRNWIIKCECEAMCCDENMKSMIRKEKDILWATALKLYLDNPDADLELNIEEFKELAELQEEAKVIKQEDIKETYNDIFERKYYVDNNNNIVAERDFYLMATRSEISLTSDNLLKESLEGKNMYFKTDYINVIPAKWISNFIKKEYSNNYMKVLKDYLLKHGWTFKQHIGFNKKCWCRIMPKSLMDNCNLFE